MNILKARSPQPRSGERAGFRDARSAALHGVTSEASGVSRWRAVPVERAPPNLAAEQQIDHLRMPWPRLSVCRCSSGSTVKAEWGTPI